MKISLKAYALLCAVFFTSLVVEQKRAEAFPVGVFLEIDPHNNDDITFLTNYASTLFGPATGGGCATGVAPCSGGITGIFLKVSWQHFDKVVRQPDGSYKIRPDGYGDVAAFLGTLSSLETTLAPICHCTLQLSIGLEAGSRASYQALDVYAISGGSSTAMTAPTADLACTNTDGTFDTFSTLNTGAGGNFPIQCVLDGPHNTCLQQPRVWGTDPNSIAANGYYQTAFVAAMESLAQQINSFPHAINLVKLSGINAADVELGIDGNPKVMQDGTGPGWCGNTGSTDSEKVWTDQATISGSTAADVYDTAAMESTWASMTNAQARQPSTRPVIDVLQSQCNHDLQQRR
jgi:hypothetical protein